MELLEQVQKSLFVAADTMNCYIQRSLTDLKKLLKRIDCLIINEDEARLLANENNLIKAGNVIIDMGPELVLIKKGGSGSILCNSDGERFILPAYPVEEVIDPTGAGDSFAGGFMGYLAQKQKTDFQALKAAVAYGTVTASFTIAGFSLKGLESISRADIDERFETLGKITSF
jgi:sugar/nucleoside kinase (ribokinase family)